MWDLVNLPVGKSAIVVNGCTRSRLDRMAFLIATSTSRCQGLHLGECFDYEETFGSVAHLSFIHTLIVVSSFRNWPLFQMDMDNAFLNRELTEEVYMQLLLGFSHPHRFSHKVCRLRQALYGLKQASQAWFAQLSFTISQHGFSASSYDSAIFFRCLDRDLLLLYM